MKWVKMFYNNVNLKKKLRTLAIFVLSILLFNTLKETALAKTSDVGEKNAVNGGAVDSSLTRHSINIDGITVQEYKEFKDPDLELKKIKEEASNIIHLAQREYQLPDLSENNIDQYFEYIDQMNTDDSLDEEWRKFEEFYDIYENTEKNTSIEENVEKKHPIDPYCLPQDSFKKLIKEDRLFMLQSSGSRFQRKYGRNYALLYAKERNSKYKSFDKDCTNFASQILIGGGKEMEYNGWYYDWKSIRALDYCTQTWSVADKFCKYWGITYKYNSHSAFSKGLDWGDFITYDTAKDGDWDHLGFVTDCKDSVNKKLGYKDYKVAQHTRDYLDWTSSDNNKWEKRTGYFGVIRLW